MKINEAIVSEGDKLFNVFKRIRPRISEWSANGVNHWHFIYLNDDPNQCIHMSGFSENIESKELQFKSVLDAVKRKHYSDLLLLVTFYGHIHNELLINKINTPKVPIDALTEILFNETSNGYLAYAHQLEQIYATLTGATFNEAITFRRDWNKKKDTVIAHSDTILYNKNITLHQYIAENCFFDEGPFFLNANFRQAKLLYESLMN